MTLLAIIWTFSLLTMVVTLLYAYAKIAGGEAGSVASPASLYFSEFIREELRHLVEHSSRVAITIKPHTSRLGLVVSDYGKRGHKAFSERLFGRILLERGKTVSFFLKYIAEHKENDRKAIAERVGY